MPWTVRDVDKHKKGLSARQKRQWVEVANSALRACQRKGGSNCEASAIRQANAVVSAHEFAPYTIENNSYTIRTEIHQGRTHIVVPVIMMVEGVHNGSHGPLLHLAEDLGRFPAAWNGIPVVIQHPEEGGEYVSANSPDVIDDGKVGTIFNTHMEDGKLKAEAWIDVEKADRVDPAAMQYIREGKQLEVSVGVFTDEENVIGNWNGEQYEAIARNHRPDHLALLPGGIGACSWPDGCGVRANEQNKRGGGEVNEKVIEAKKLIGIEDIPQINKQGYRELITGIQTKLDNMDDDRKVHFLTEVYEDFFVYEVRSRLEGGPGAAFYKRGYSVGTDDIIEFTGEAQQVKRKIEYVNVHKGMIRMKENKTKEVKDMEKKAEKVQTLIKNCRTGCFNEESKTELEALDETMIDQLIAMQEATNKKLDALEVESKKGKGQGAPMTQEQAVQVFQEQFKDMFKDTESALKIFPKEIADQMRHGLKLNEAERGKLISVIREAEPEAYSEEQLKVKTTDELEMLVRYIKPQVNYGPLGGSDDRTSGVEPMLPPDVEVRIAANEKGQQKAAE